VVRKRSPRAFAGHSAGQNAEFPAPPSADRQTAPSRRSAHRRHHARSFRKVFDTTFSNGLARETVANSRRVQAVNLSQYFSHRLQKKEDFANLLLFFEYEK